MKMKRFAIRGLIALVIIIALCMFFANTIVTITTPKVRIVEVSKGRLEQKINLDAQVYFPKTSDYTLPEAMDHSIIVDKVYVRAGQTVVAGETLFTAIMPEYEQSMQDLQDKYSEKAAELLDMDIKNPRIDKESSQNDYYKAVLDLQTALSQAEHDARVLAAEMNVALGTDTAQWEQRAAGQDDLLAAVQSAVAAQTAYDEAYAAFIKSYNRASSSFKENTFQYIKDRDALLDEMNDLLDDMVALTKYKNKLTNVTAPHDGYVVSMDVNNGDTYEGKTSAFTLSASDSPPQLRADITSISKTISDGTKVEVESSSRTKKTTVESTALGGDGKKYLYIALTDDIISAKGGIVSILTDGSMTVTVRYRGKQSATLLPAAAVRSDGEDSDYVYTIQNYYGGFLNSSSMKVTKTSVTVLERGDTMVSVNEDLSYQKIASGEDRALSDNCNVMEYID